MLGGAGRYALGRHDVEEAVLRAPPPSGELSGRQGGGRAARRAGGHRASAPRRIAALRCIVVLRTRVWARPGPTTRPERPPHGPRARREALASKKCPQKCQEDLGSAAAPEAPAAFAVERGGRSDFRAQRSAPNGHMCASGEDLGPADAE